MNPECGIGLQNWRLTIYGAAFQAREYFSAGEPETPAGIGVSPKQLEYLKIGRWEALRHSLGLYPDIARALY